MFRTLLGVIVALATQPNLRAPGPIVLGAVQVTDTTVTRTLRSSRTPPGTALEWTVTAAPGWSNLPTNLIVAADTMRFTARRTVPWATDTATFCAQAWNRRGSEKSAGSVSLCWQEKRTAVLPPPGPIDTAGAVPVELLFVDRFIGGVRAPPQNGVGYTSTNGPEPILIVPDATSSSGFAMRLAYRGVPAGQDSFTEQNGRLGELPEVFICTTYRIPANYFHRDDTGPDNNKGLRLFGGMRAGASRDSAYQHSSAKAGYSTLPHATTSPAYGTSDIIITEFGTTEGSTGNYGTGPWVKWFQADSIIKIGLYAKSGTVTGTTNPLSGQGIVRIWRNGHKVYDRADLPIGITGANNKFQYFYFTGWANSGFAETTYIYVHEFIVARQPFASCITP